MMGPPQIEQKNPGDLSPRTHWMKGGTMKLKSNDPLLRASHEVRFGGGSTKTRVNHLREVKKFVEELRKQGYGVKHWKNITNKHVGVVVDAWKDRGLANATMKEYLSGVRAVAERWGNDRISPKNSDFGIGKRTQVTNKDLSMSPEKYEFAVSDMKNGNDELNRIAAEMMLMRELGLRHEEARKFNPNRDVLSDGRIHVGVGTKAGRERWLQPDAITDKGREAIEYARSVIGDGRGLIKPGLTEKQWKDKTYRIVSNKYGITKKESNNSFHGLRHAYAQERYERYTGFSCRCRFENREKFVENASSVAGDNWERLDHDARELLKSEMGHGPDRNDVIENYLGSRTS
jgi:integrase